MATTYPQWEYDILTGIGAPATVGNLDALNYWGQSEGVANRNNPLAVSTKYAGATTCIAQCGGTSPIYAYDTEADGVAANVKFLKGSGYSHVIAAFVKDQGLSAIWSAINSSGWCKGCSGGKYPAVLYDALGANKPPLTAQPSGGPSTGGANAAAAAGTATPGTCGAKGKIFGVATLSFSYCQGKALVGGLLVGFGGVIMLTGVLIVVAWGIGHTKGGQAALTAASAVPGPTRVAATAARRATNGRVKAKAPAKPAKAPSAPKAPAAPKGPSAPKQAMTQEERNKRRVDAMSKDEVEAARQKRIDSGVQKAA